MASQVVNDSGSHGQKERARQAQYEAYLRQLEIQRQRAAIAAQQEAEMRRLQQLQEQEQVRQQEQAEALRAEEARQQQQIAAARLATNAAAASLKILMPGLQQVQAPTAAMTKAPRTAAKRRGASSSELRIGSGATAPGVGLNIGR